ncbi:unnamed protein product [Spodoptera littoralis]|uniref:Uncharacterized protein n=1 Tax=Spodoptera littoralis TaxID=7109 RepID=A0A9P0HUQ7_SPOLI|nr:unnamed protein product [Spodoptera littoralis]CAH1635678.1 unnamed protein product [Spodoptera littoralis]
MCLRICIRNWVRTLRYRLAAYFSRYPRPLHALAITASSCLMAVSARCPCSDLFYFLPTRHRYSHSKHDRSSFKYKPVFRKPFCNIARNLLCWHSNDAYRNKQAMLSS